MTFLAYLAEEDGKAIKTSWVERDSADLPAGDVEIEVSYSSVNYKDALSASGNRGVTKEYPHTPGIDAAGVVSGCSDGTFEAGDEVVVFGYDLGMNTAGDMVRKSVFLPVGCLSYPRG